MGLRVFVLLFTVTMTNPSFAGVGYLSYETLEPDLILAINTISTSKLRLTARKTQAGLEVIALPQGPIQNSGVKFGDIDVFKTHAGFLGGYDICMQMASHANQMTVKVLETTYFLHFVCTAKRDPNNNSFAMATLSTYLLPVP